MLRRPTATVLVLLIGLLSCHRAWTDLRNQMVEEQIKGRGIRDPLVVKAVGQVPRHLFLAEDQQRYAYQDRALPIGFGHKTPEPYVVALMSEVLEVRPGDKVLEIGTGCGYHTAILAAMGAEVYSIEIQPQLCQGAARLLQRLGYSSIQVRCGNGLLGWPEEAPFDAIVVTGAYQQVPEPLLDQLADNGCLVIPVGDFYQEIKLIRRNGDRLAEQSVIPVRFRQLDDR